MKICRLLEASAKSSFPSPLKSPTATAEDGVSPDVVDRVSNWARALELTATAQIKARAATRENLRSRAKGAFHQPTRKRVQRSMAKHLVAGEFGFVFAGDSDETNRADAVLENQPSAFGV